MQTVSSAGRQLDRLVLALVHKPLQVAGQARTARETALGSVDHAVSQVEVVDSVLNGAAHVLGTDAEITGDRAPVSIRPRPQA